MFAAALKSLSTKTGCPVLDEHVRQKFCNNLLEVTFDKFRIDQQEPILPEDLYLVFKPEHVSSPKRTVLQKSCALQQLSPSAT